jgi:hypothetical protein
METSNVEFSKVVTARYPFSRVAEAVDYADQQLGLKSTVYFSANVEAN